MVWYESEHQAWQQRELQYQEAILDLKRLLVATRGVRDTLRRALIEIAPEHPMVNPVRDNPILGDVSEAVFYTVQNWDDEV